MQNQTATPIGSVRNDFLLIGYIPPKENPESDFYQYEIITAGSVSTCTQIMESETREDISGFAIIPVPHYPTFTKQDYFWIKTYEHVQTVDDEGDRLIRAKFIPGKSYAFDYLVNHELPNLTHGQYAELQDTAHEILARVNSSKNLEL